MTVDPAHPFPRVINKALCVAFLLKRRRRAATTFMGVITVPRSLPRLVRLPSEKGSDNYIFLADLVAYHAASVYRGYDILSSAAFRVTRNSNLYLQEEESRSLLESVRTELHNRRRGDAVRLEIEAGADPEIIERLRTTFELENWQVFQTDGPVNLSRLFTLHQQSDRPDLKFRPFVPRQLHLTAKSRDLFEELRRHDLLLHHPFDSYDTVVGFIEAAAADPRVLSIKQTLYRTSEDSPIMRALVEAAARKEVTVVVELKARFDVVVMSDVIYYEQDLAGIWRMLPEIVVAGGCVIIRSPNTLTLITLAHYVSRLFGSRKSSKMSDRISFFTPDHFFVFSRRFLTTRRTRRSPPMRGSSRARTRSIRASTRS